MNKALLSSKKMDWCTPQDFFDKLNEEFHFDLDACATDKSAKCGKWYTEKEDGLSQDWHMVGSRVFVNPPYGREIGKWVKKSAMESQLCEVVVMLIPSRTDTNWFHDYILEKAKIRFIRGRLQFTDEDGAIVDRAPFPSMVVIFRRDNG
jgi:phage N-6-adenine-methyltransferase